MLRDQYLELCMDDIKLHLVLTVSAGKGGRKMDNCAVETRGGFREEIIQETAVPWRVGRSQYYMESG